MGTPASPGTKTFALTGHVSNTGLIEVPFGTSLRHIVYEVGGGVTAKDGAVDPDGFKAVQIGGPSGGCLTRDHLDLPMDFDNLTRIGAMVGSGGLVVMNQDTCMVQVAKFFMQFTQNESCGKCVPCREGTRQMLALLEDITEGRATEETLPLLELLARNVQARRPLRPGQDRAQSGAVHPAALPGRVRGPRAPEGLPQPGVQGPHDPGHRGVPLQGLHPLRPEVPRGRHPRRAQGPPQHRPRQVHPLRRLRGSLQIQRDHGSLT